MPTVETTKTIFGSAAAQARRRPLRILACLILAREKKRSIAANGSPPRVSATRFIVCLSFVLIVALFREHAAAAGGIVWGMSLLTVLTYILARHRKVSPMSELGKHLAVALVIVFVSKSIGHWITAHVV